MQTGKENPMRWYIVMAFSVALLSFSFTLGPRIGHRGLRPLEASPSRKPDFGTPGVRCILGIGQKTKVETLKSGGRHRIDAT